MPRSIVWALNYASETLLPSAFLNRCFLLHKRCIMLWGGDKETTHEVNERHESLLCLLPHTGLHRILNWLMPIASICGHMGLTSSFPASKNIIAFSHRNRAADTSNGLPWMAATSIFFRSEALEGYAFLLSKLLRYIPIISQLCQIALFSKTWNWQSLQRQALQQRRSMKDSRRWLSFMPFRSDPFVM